MADRYWVGGTAAWDGTAGTKWALTSGGAGGQAVPTAADDVFFDGASGAVTCTITGSRVAKSINCTGFTGTLAGASTPALTISGSLTLVAGMTLTYAGTTTFNGTGTLTSGGKTLGAITINGSGITVTLGDALTSSGRITVTQGTFTTSASNYNITASSLHSSGTSTRTISLNGSTVNLSGNFLSTTINFATATNLTFNSGTSQINLSDDSPLLEGGGRTFYDVSFTNTSLVTVNAAQISTINGANTFNNLTFAARDASGVGCVILGANQTINGTFTVQSGATDPTRRLFIESSVVGTARTITSASNSLWGVDFQDITGAGAASWDDSSRTNYWGDCKGNSGITFATGRTVYWNLAGTQNWSATGWTNTSTGTPNAQYFPLAQDTVTFTNAGSAGTVTINSAWNIGTVDMSGRTSAMTWTSNSNNYIYGNWTSGTGVTFSGTNTTTFCGRNTQTITSNSRTFSFGIPIDSLGGTVQLGDDISIVSTRSLRLTRGTFNANNYNVTAGNFDSNNSNTRTLTMGSGLWTLTGTGTIWDLTTVTNLTFNKDTANILLSDTSTTARTFIGGGRTYNKLTIGGTTGISATTITGSNTFSELASTKTVAHTISFGANQTITTWSVTGTSGNVVTVNSDNAGTARTLTITNRTSGIDWLDVRDITASLAPVTFYAGANTRLRSNVQGVAAIAPTANQFIYVLNTGTSWTVPSDWNSSNNEIHLFAGGGGGAGGRSSGSNRAGGGGGGGGGYTKVTNLTLTPSGSVSYAIGAGGAAGAANTNGGAGGNTTFDSGTYTTVGGGGGQATTTSSTGGVAGTGSNANGGVGGQGSISTSSSFAGSGGAGAGAGGPLGNGGNGGNSFASGDSTVAGGGGGGNGGGGNGGNASSGTGGTGGNNADGVGGGASNTAGFNGGGGGGYVGVVNGVTGSSGRDISNAGMGGSAGSSGGVGAAVGGLFGGGASGGGVGSGGTAQAGRAGGQGGIIIWYSASAAPASNGNFFFLFG